MTISALPASPTPLAAPARTPGTPGVVRKVTGRRMAGSVLARAFHPGHLWRAGRLQRNRKANRKAFDDARLALYAQILPSDFLHYGYFEDPATRPEQVSLDAVAKAQTRYAELLLELVGDAPGGPVLDVGCGMGGLSRMMKDRGWDPVALTPDKLQAAYVGKYVPGVPVLRCKLEALKVEDHAAEYAAVVTAESLQYLKLDQALPIIEGVLRPGGSWVACDYFSTGPTPDKTCHQWDPFVKRVAEAGWRVAYQRDVTAHVLPTLAFIHMLATRFGLPLMDFAVLRLRRKQPGLHHLLAGLLGHVEGMAVDNVGLIDPAQFGRDRQYMLMKLERA